MASEDRTAFARAVLETLEAHDDIASEACWKELSKVVAQYWLVFSQEQSPLSSWGMLAKCTETILKIRAVAKAEKGSSGGEALAEFRQMMGEVLADEK